MLVLNVETNNSLLTQLYLRLWRTQWGKHHRVAIFNTNQTDVGQRRGCGKKSNIHVGEQESCCPIKARTLLTLHWSCCRVLFSYPFTVSGGNDGFVGIPVTPTSFPFNRNHICFVYHRYFWKRSNPPFGKPIFCFLRSELTCDLLTAGWKKRISQVDF